MESLRIREVLFYAQRLESGKDLPFYRDARSLMSVPFVQKVKRSVSLQMNLRLRTLFLKKTCKQTYGLCAFAPFVCKIIRGNNGQKRRPAANR